MKIIAVVIALMLIAAPVCAGEAFVSYQAGVLMPEDDNFGYGKGFFTQGAEAGYSFKYAEVGCEWMITNLKTLFDSTFTDHSVIGTVKIKYPLTWKWLDRLTPYGVVGAGMHFFTNQNMKGSPDQIGNDACGPETIADSGFALKYGGGIQYRLTDRVSIFGEASYRYGNEGQGSSLAVYSWIYNGGIRIKF